MKLSAVHLEPNYREVLEECTQELSDLTRVNLTVSYKDARATIFISSPGEFTPYHIDQEANFLLTLQGSKTISILDGEDRETLPWKDLEIYWQGGGTIPPSEATIKQARQFKLRPGLGVHNPVNFPHWVQNGSTPSVALSLGFTRLKDPVDILRVNFYLRKLGLSPNPPGESLLSDSTKRMIIECGRKVKRSIGRGYETT
jgi:hypothetical protein